jgi:hypothetical protein
MAAFIGAQVLVFEIVSWEIFKKVRPHAYKPFYLLFKNG